jgi:hypothetical protein
MYFYHSIILFILFIIRQQWIIERVTEMENHQHDYATKLKEKLVDQNPTEVHEIDGVGIVRVYGHWDAEKIINRLLESDSITGYN